MRATLLLVTWFVAGQAPSSYHVEFGSMPACQNARTAILADAKRIASELWAPRGPPKPPPPPPSYGLERTGAPVEVSALCVPLVSN